MLALNSPQWGSFDTYFGTSEDLPESLRSWREAIGTPDEEGEWGRLRDHFLCQHTIKDSAISSIFASGSATSELISPEMK